MNWILAQDDGLLHVPAWIWGTFIGAVVLLLALDLVVFHKRAHEVRTSEAVKWSIFWVSLALAFNVWIWWHFDKGQVPAVFGGDAEPGARFHSIDFLTGYLIEESLSVDNLFVFLLLFSFFRVPAKLQHRVLFFGILGAIVFRFLFVWLGTELLHRFEWVMYVFGGFLVLTAAKLLFQKEDKDPTKSVIVRALQKSVPFVPEYHDTRLTVVKDGKRFATMLFIVVCIVEATDVVFAVDSVPAVFAVTREPFIVFTSNICAILGLRSLFFLLARFMSAFRYLKPGLALVLLFVGVNMLGVFHLGSGPKLVVIAGILATATVASLLHKKSPDETEKALEEHVAHDVHVDIGDAVGKAPPPD